MSIDFNELIDRRGTNSIKYDFFAERGKPEGVLPLWVADMDFRTPVGVTNALKKYVEHGIYGYTEVKEDYFHSVARWYERRFGWKVQREWLVKTPGIVYAIACTVKAYTKEGESVLIQRPVYYPFSETIVANRRKLVNNPLRYNNGTYEMDFEDFEAKIIEHKVKLFILCSPHNPVGRVWTKEELERIGDICVKHNVIVVSDEIHSDFIYSGYQHYVFSEIKEEFESISVICTAPSKTFNLAGLQVSNIFIPSKELRHRFIAEIRASGYSQLNTLGLVACQAAYEEGEEWLEALKVYLADNLSLIRDYLAKELPQIKLIEPQGTYLVWLDLGALSLEVDDLEDLISSKAKLWLDGGTMFGKEGQGFQRVNIACPRSLILQALNQLRDAIHTMNS